MSAPAPILDEELLDQLARIFMRQALDELMQELADGPQSEATRQPTAGERDQ